MRSCAIVHALNAGGRAGKLTLTLPFYSIIYDYIKVAMRACVIHAATTLISSSTDCLRSQDNDFNDLLPCKSLFQFVLEGTT